MKTLREQQIAFSDYLKGDKTSLILEDIIGDDKATSVERLDLYHDAYKLRLIDVLGTDYPGLKSLLGEDDFTRICLAYIEHCPSTYRSVRWFGQQLPEFLEANEHYTFDPRLFEIAQFEKLKGDVFDAKESPVASLEDLSAIEPHLWGGLL